MEAALKHAAYKAIHGTREERSGRFNDINERRSQGDYAVRSQRGRDNKTGGKDRWRKP